MSNSGYARVRGAELYYEVTGSGAPVLLIHAGVADARMWDELADALAPRYRVIRFDQRGYGRTRLHSGAFGYHDDVAALLDYLGEPSAHLVGCSFGGRVALDAALEHPTYVRSLVLCSASASGETASARIEAFAAEEEALLEAGDIDGAARLNVTFWVDGPHRTPEQVDDAVRRRVYAMQHAAFLVELPPEFEVRAAQPAALQRLADVTAPVLVVAGAMDVEEKVALARQLAAGFSNTRLVVVPDAGHILPLEKPELFASLVLDFLGSLE